MEEIEFGHVARDSKGKEEERAQASYRISPRRCTRLVVGVGGRRGVQRGKMEIRSSRHGLARVEKE